jgi:hypothetical protein
MNEIVVGNCRLERQLEISGSEENKRIGMVMKLAHDIIIAARKLKMYILNFQSDLHRK